jgi:hypothetical protein
VIVGGPLGQGEGDAASFALIHIRRIDCTIEEGLIGSPGNGWLPAPKEV